MCPWSGSIRDMWPGSMIVASYSALSEWLCILSQLSSSSAGTSYWSILPAAYIYGMSRKIPSLRRSTFALPFAWSNSSFISIYFLPPFLWFHHSHPSVHMRSGSTCLCIRHSYSFLLVTISLSICLNCFWWCRIVLYVMSMAAHLSRINLNNLF